MIRKKQPQFKFALNIKSPHVHIMI